MVFPNVRHTQMHEDTRNAGEHVLHTGGRFDSHFLVPVIESTARCNSLIIDSMRYELYAVEIIKWHAEDRHGAGRTAGSPNRSEQVRTSSKLTGIEHFAMPTRNIAQLERFVREVLGGEPYCYAGYDDVDRKMGRKPHIFIRVGEILFQCTQEGGPMHPSKDDMSVSPHWAFSIEPENFDGFMKYCGTMICPTRDRSRSLSTA